MLDERMVAPAMKRPDEVNLSREEGEALIERIEGNALTAEDRNVLVQVLRVYLWLLFALQEAKISLKRLRTQQRIQPRRKLTVGSRLTAVVAQAMGVRGPMRMWGRSASSVVMRSW